MPSSSPFASSLALSYIALPIASHLPARTATGHVAAPSLFLCPLCPPLISIPFSALALLGAPCKQLTQRVYLCVLRAALSANRPHPLPQPTPLLCFRPPFFFPFLLAVRCAVSSRRLQRAVSVRAKHTQQHAHRRRLLQCTCKTTTRPIGTIRRLRASSVTLEGKLWERRRGGAALGVGRAPPTARATFAGDGSVRACLDARGWAAQVVGAHKS